MGEHNAWRVPPSAGHGPEPMDEEALERQWNVLHNGFSSDLSAAALRFMDRETFTPEGGKAPQRVRFYTPALRSLMDKRQVNPFNCSNPFPPLITRKSTPKP